MKYTLLILTLLSFNTFNSSYFSNKEKEVIVLQLTETGKHVNYIYKFDLEGKLKSYENPYEEIVLKNQSKSGKVITIFKYNLNGKVKEEVRKHEISSIEGQLRFRRIFEYNEDDKLIWESYTKSNKEYDIRTTEYFYDENGLLEKIKQKDLEDENKHIIYRYNYSENKILKSITFKKDTSDIEIIFKEDEKKALINCYHINSNQRKKAYSTFYTKNTDGQFKEYKFLSKNYKNADMHKIFKYSKNQLLEQINTNYSQKEQIYDFIDKYEYKNRRHLKNLKEDVIKRINKKLIEINSNDQSIWSLVNVVKQ